MRIKIDGKTVNVTPNELAKYYVQDMGENAYYWNESHPDIADQLSEKQIQEVADRITHHLRRVWEYLGCEKIHNKLTRN